MQKFIYLEPLTRVELVTPSLPRKCSTTELQRHLFSKKNERKECFSPPSVSSVAFSSGRRGSNPPPIAWKAIALPNELLPLTCVGKGGLEPPNSSEDRFTVCCNCRYATSPLPLQSLEACEPMEGFEPPTPRLQITCSGQLSYIGIGCFIIFK